MLEGLSRRITSAYGRSHRTRAVVGYWLPDAPLEKNHTLRHTYHHSVTIKFQVSSQFKRFIVTGHLKHSLSTAKTIIQRSVRIDCAKASWHALYRMRPMIEIEFSQSKSVSNHAGCLSIL